MLDGVQIHPVEVAIFGVVRLRPTENIVTVVLYVAKKINNGITAPLLQRSAMLPIGRCHITLFPVTSELKL